MFCTSSHSALNFCEVWCKYLRRYQSYGADTNDGSADGWTNGRTDPQNFGRYNIIPSPHFVEGHKKTLQNMFVLYFELHQN